MDGATLSRTVGFALAGFALLAALRQCWSPLAQRTCAVLLLVLGGLELGLHGPLGPFDDIGFLIFGAAMIVLPRVQSHNGAEVVRGLTALILADALVTILGHFLHLEALFSFKELHQQPLAASGGLFALGICLWLMWRGERWNRSGLAMGHGRRILSTAALVLVVVVVAAGFSGFLLLQILVRRDSTEELTLRREERAVYIAVLLEQAERRDAQFARSPWWLRRLIGSPNGNPPRLPTGFAAAWLERLPGSVIASFGQPVARDAPSVALPERGTELIWYHGFYLRQRIPVANDSQRGAVVTEQQVPLLAAVGVESTFWGATGEIGLCGRSSESGNMLCFPQRLHPTPFLLSESLSGVERPMALALTGQRGVAETTDYRGQEVLAAYGPVTGSGMGVVAKMDATELYAPLRRQFEVMVPLLAVLAIIGMQILRWQVRPLLRQLVESRNRALSSEARFRAAAESGMDPFYIFESERDPVYGAVSGFRLIYANHPGEELGQLQPEAMSRLGLEQIAPLAQRSDMLEKFSRAVASRSPVEEEFAWTGTAGAPAGGVRWLHLQAAPLGDGVAVTLRDISERKRHEARLLSMAQTDGLTGLANRTAFREQLESALDPGNSLSAVLFLDVDHFKQINDTHGHGVGDRVLQTFAARLRGCVRRFDTVARPGGDEFTILLQRLESPVDAERVVDAIFTALRDPIHLDGLEVPIATSIGLAYSAPGITGDEMLRRADVALYAAKRRGRNRHAVFVRDS